MNRPDSRRDSVAHAQAPVDHVLGMDTTPRSEHLAQLPHLDHVLKETLRVWPTAPAWGRQPRDETVIGGKYVLKHHQPLVVLTQMLYRDPKVWGPNPERFDPERFAPEAAARLPANA